MNKTVFLTKKKNECMWFLFDAESKTLGRLSTEISRVLLGKNEPYYSPSHNINHGVIVINAEKIFVTGKKINDKFYYRHSGRPGGLTIETFREVQKRIPSRILEKAVKGMLPKGPLGRKLFTQLKVYKGSLHPHQAQNPKQIKID
jgi:large subunit ribosomal protein L13|uniref:ribosomal protein L13 n=1 Tax=Cryptomonas pyrenoidifera TaxID=233184 RepID=UPI0022A6CD0C|nr:ribosomal protein L13 [Cryptomonas pyrenoidifera]UZS90609.1 ribosomal protein L13 [Cryptomonas pyrenoidifera]